MPLMSLPARCLELCGGQDHKRIVIDGLWARVWQRQSREGPTDKRLVLRGGPSDENDGFFGHIDASDNGACIASDDD